MSKEKVTEVVIGVLAIVSIFLVAIESLISVSQEVLIGICIADLLICIVFAIDFTQRLIASKAKLKFVMQDGYEIFAMIPAIALYALETTPSIAIALRTLRLLRVARVVVLLARMRRILSISSQFVQRSHLIALLGITVVVILIGAFSALIFDSETENAQITNFLDAIWWSITTVTTVGYGDIVPKSFAGRIMGMVLMVIGIGIMSAFISEISATLVESRIKQNSDKDDFRTAIISELKNRIDNIDKLSESEVSLIVQTIQTLNREGKTTV